MAKEERPYLPWYVKDWLTSESRDRMTFEARGVYFDLLCKAWLDHGLTADKEVLARMLGLTPHKFALIWSMVGPSWQEQDGRLINPKQEEVRAELNDFREGKREAGRAGGKASAEKRALGKQDASRTQAEVVAKSNPSSSSSSSKSVAPTLMQPRNRDAVFEHPRFDVPGVWHRRRVVGLADGEQGMRNFYAYLAAHVEKHPKEDTEPRFDWLTKHFDAWVRSRMASASSDVPDIEETRRRLAR